MAIARKPQAHRRHTLSLPVPPRTDHLIICQEALEKLHLSKVLVISDQKPMAGFEPATARLRIECSTTEPHRHTLKHNSS